MRRRFLAAVAALLLLVVGTAILVAYVKGADARALAGTRTVSVLVVDSPIDSGTRGEDVAGKVHSVPVPASVALPGRVTDLASLDGRVASVDLQPGEQLLASRFVRPDALQAPGTVTVPAGLQEVSVLLEPQRAAGGRLAAGDTVGVVISLGGQGPGTTHMVLQKVLVTQIQGAPAPVDASKSAQTASSGAAAPTQSLLVTLAVSAAQAEAVVFGAEHGTLWLTLEPKDAETGGTTVLTPDTIYGKSFR